MRNDDLAEVMNTFKFESEYALTERLPINVYEWCSLQVGKRQ